MSSRRIVIVGTGNMGRIHARILSDMGVLAGVADTDMATVEEVAQTHNTKAFNDFESMLDETKPDGVVISTPTSTHANIARAIATNYDGIKGILIEKPMTSTLEDGKNLAEVVKEKGIVVLVSHSEIYNPIVERALTLIKTDAIGTPRSVIHDRRGFVAPDRIESLGDVFEDIGVHDFDIMARISNGHAKLYAQSNKQGEIHNSGTVMVKFDSGTEHTFHLSRQYAGRRRYMDVSGTKGTLVLDLFGQIIKIQHLDQAPVAKGDTIQLPERGATIKVYGEPVREVIKDFLKCIETGESPRVNIDDGLHALDIVEAARKSAESGKIIDIEVEPRN